MSKKLRCRFGLHRAVPYGWRIPFPWRCCDCGAEFELTFWGLRRR